MSTPPRHSDETHPTSATSPLPETPAKKARVAKHTEYSPIPTRTRGQASALETIMNPQTPTNLEPKDHFLPPGPIVPYIKFKCLRELIKIKEKAGLTAPFVEMRTATMEVGDYGYVKYNVKNARGHCCYLSKI